MIAVRLHRYRRPGAPHHQHFLDAFCALVRQRFIDAGFQGDVLAAAQPFVGGDDVRRAAIGDAPRKRLGGESREHHRVHGTEPRAGEHGDGDLGNHRQIDGDAVALANAERLQGVGALAHALVELSIAQALGTSRIVRFPDDSGLVAALLEMAVQTVRRHVESAVVEPADVKIRRVKTHIFDARKGLQPIDAPSDLPPEILGRADCFGIHSGVIAAFDSRGIREARWNRI